MAPNFNVTKDPISFFVIKLVKSDCTVTFTPDCNKTAVIPAIKQNPDLGISKNMKQIDVKTIKRFFDEIFFFKM